MWQPVNSLLQFKQNVFPPVAFQASGCFFLTRFDARVGQLRPFVGIPLTLKNGPLNRLSVNTCCVGVDDAQPRVGRSHLPRQLPGSFRFSTKFDTSALGCPLLLSTPVDFVRELSCGRPLYTESQVTGELRNFIPTLAALAATCLAAHAATRLTITSAAPRAAPVDIAYSQTFTASGGTLPYSWTVIAGVLPTGLSLNAATGLLSGTPLTAGPYQFAVRVQDSANAVESTSVSLLVQPAPLVIATKSPLPAGVAGLDYPQQILAATGGIAPYTFSIPATSLPAGITLSNGVIGGTPTVAGTFSAPLTVTDAAGVTAATTLAIVIRPATNDLTLSLASVSLSLPANAAAVPTATRILVQSSVASLPLNYTAVASPQLAWLAVSSDGATPDTLLIGLSSAALTFAPGDYPANVVVTCTSAACLGKTQNIAVDVTVTAQPPRLKVPNTLLAYSSTPDVPDPPAQLLTLLNNGSGVLGIISVSCAASWCSVSGVPTSVTAGLPALVTVTVTPVNRASGYYTTTVTVVSAAGSASIPVTLRISPGEFSLTPTVAQFHMLAGTAPGNPNGSFQLAVSGLSSVNWTATLLPGVNWLNIAPTSGTVAPGHPVLINYAINSSAVALATQTWFATIRLSGAGVVNSPRDFQVLLTVAAAGSAVKPQPSPAGLVFVTTAGSSPPPQAIQLFSDSKTAAVYSAAATTVNGGSWLVISPNVGLSSASAPDTTVVAVNSAGLPVGIYQGAVSYASSGAGVRAVNVTLIVHRPPTGTTCVPSVLAPTQTALVNNFSASASWLTPLAIRLADDCGNTVANGQVVATFSNGDPPLSLSLTDAASGTYSATWTPRKSGSQVNVTARASAPGFPLTTAEISGAVLPNSAPALAPNSVLHVFSPQIGAPLAPGTIVQIYGSNLASQAGQPTAIPLPVSMNNTSVVIGGIAAPLYYVGPGQINSQIPFELNASGEFEVIVSANGALTAPQTIQLVPAAPGLAVYGDGTVVAQHQDGSLITRASPAIPLEYAVVYLAGMGGTDNPVVTGAGSPSNPLARPTDVPALTIGGAPVPVLFAGLTPSLVGLYQMNFQIPATATGNLKLEVSQNGQGSNSTELPVQ